MDDHCFCSFGFGWKFLFFFLFMGWSIEGVIFRKSMNLVRWRGTQSGISRFGLSPLIHLKKKKKHFLVYYPQVDSTIAVLDNNSSQKACIDSFTLQKNSNNPYSFYMQLYKNKEINSMPYELNTIKEHAVVKPPLPLEFSHK